MLKSINRGRQLRQLRSFFHLASVTHCLKHTQNASYLYVVMNTIKESYGSGCSVLLNIKAPRPQFGHKMEKKTLKYPKNLNTCVIKHNLLVPCASFKENFAQTRSFSKTPFNMRENYLLNGTDKGFISLFIFLTMLS